MQKQLETLASIDSLTAISNRYSINLVIDEEIKRVQRYKGSFALIMFDIDFFKKVNDTYGHDVGDSVLKELSNIISQNIRDTDKFGRWGGEEFMLVLPNEEISNAIEFTNKLRIKVEKHPFKIAGKITVSIGLAIYNGLSDKGSFLKQVDEALYRAKENGRNCVVA